MPDSVPVSGTGLATPAPAAPRADDRPPPVRAVFLIWPGSVHLQTWMFLWIAVTFVVSALLPWSGALDSEYVLRHGGLISAAAWLAGQARQDPAMGEVVQVIEPGMSLGAALLLLCAIGMVVNAASNIWNRRLVLWPTLLTWLVGFSAVFFSSGPDVDRGLGVVRRVSGVEQAADAAGAVLGHLLPLIRGEQVDHLSPILARFGLGFYLGLLTVVFVAGFIGASVLAGLAGPRRAARGQ